MLKIHIIVILPDACLALVSYKFLYLHHLSTVWSWPFQNNVAYYMVMSANLGIQRSDRRNLSDTTTIQSRKFKSLSSMLCWNSGYPGLRSLLLCSRNNLPAGTCTAVSMPGYQDKLKHLVGRSHRSERLILQRDQMGHQLQRPLAGYLDPAELQHSCKGVKSCRSHVAHLDHMPICPASKALWYCLLLAAAKDVSQL